MTHKSNDLFTFICFLIAIVCLTGCTNNSINQLDPEDVKANNQGVAFMGQFDFESANRVFTDLNKRYPENIIIRINQAISILNRQGPNDEQLALDILNRVLAKDKTNINAQYCSGLIELHMGRLEKSLGYFLNVLTEDPADPEVLYFIGKTLTQLSRYDEALKYFYRSLEIDQYISSSYYSIIMVMRQLGKKDEAMAMIKDYQQLKNNPRARTLDFKYTRMGEKAEAITINIDDIQQNEQPEGPIFNEPENVNIISNQEDNELFPKNYGITICDINHDNYPDLFLPGVFTGNNNVYNAILSGTENIKNYKLVSSHPLAGIENVNTALWGDINDDGLVDVYLCRRGANQLWLQNKSGKWENVTKESRTGGGDFNTVDGAVFDADHDGDLDIFLVNFDGPNELLNNNRDTTFRPLAREYGLSGKNMKSRSIVLKDFDNDRDVDIIIINDNPPHEVYINQRLWRYESAKGFEDFIKSDIKSIVAGDLNSDGNWEIYTLDSNYSLLRWVLNQNHKWQKKYLYNEPKNDFIREDKRFFMLSLSDYDGDGDIDILQSGHHGWKILSFEKEKLKTISSFQTKDNTPFLTLGEISTRNGPAIIGIKQGKNLEIWTPGPGRFLFCNISLSGREERDKNIRTNSSGIGTKLSIRNGSQWTVMALDKDINHYPSG